VEAPWEHEPADLMEQVRRAPGVPTLVFVTVPEGKTAKNRLHLDVSPIDRSQEAEVERLVGLGARHADVGQGNAALGRARRPGRQRVLPAVTVRVTSVS